MLLKELATKVVQNVLVKNNGRLFSIHCCMCELFGQSWLAQGFLVSLYLKCAMHEVSVLFLEILYYAKWEVFDVLNNIK